MKPKFRSRVIGMLSIDDMQHREKSAQGDVKRPRYWQGVRLAQDRPTQTAPKDLPF